MHSDMVVRGCARVDLLGSVVPAVGNSPSGFARAQKVARGREERVRARRAAAQRRRRGTRKRSGEARCKGKRASERGCATKRPE